MFCLVSVLVSVIFAISVNGSENTIVTLPNGKIQGSIAYTPRNKVKFWAFQGIPFAAPPIGKYRFQPPQPVVNWNGILDTSKTDTRICYQTKNDHVGATEDCLYLNVYTPKEPGTGSSLPVVVHIHGGAFIGGRSLEGVTTPQFVIEQGVVIVSINYRLGPFGFLSTNDTVIPGNMGLKDQQYALMWTKRNVHLFGGDPNKITIMGQSAGSASVSYQLLIPSSKGLFRGAIGQSGSALNTWAFQRNPVETAYGIASLIDPSFTRNRTSQELLELLLSIDAEKIHNTNHKYKVICPVIEVPHEGAAITESMYQAAAHGRFNRLPYLGGIASEEGIVTAASMDKWKKMVKKYDEFLEFLVDDDMYINDEKTKTEVGYKIREIYTNKTFSEDIGRSLQYHGDDRYMRAPIKFAELISNYTDVYFYQFSYHGPLGKNTHLIDGIDKVGHAEDLWYLWVPQTSLDSFPASDRLTVDRYVGLLTNFIKYLNPLPEKSELFQNLTLPKVTPERFPYFDLDENLSIKFQPRKLFYEKWVDIYEKYARKPLISF